MVLSKSVHAVIFVEDKHFATYSPAEFTTTWLEPLTEHPAIRGVTVLGAVGRFAAAINHPKVTWADGDWDEVKHIAAAASAFPWGAVLRLRHSQPLRFALCADLIDAALAGYAQNADRGYYQLDLHDLPYDGMTVEVLGRDAAAALKAGKIPLDWLVAHLGPKPAFPIAQGNLPIEARAAVVEDPRNEWYHFPKFIALEASRLCNLRCTMCALHSDFIDHSHTDDHPKHFDLGRYRAILDQLEPYKKHLSIAPQFWGEPFMSPYLKDMIREGCSRGYTLGFTTNGTLWDDAMIDFMIEQQVQIICVSLDGATKATYEQVRIGADFDKVIANLNRLLERKRELGSQLPYLQINMALFPENRHEQEKLVRDWLGRANVVSVGNNCVNNVVPELHFRPERIPCPTLWLGMHINTNGDVVACCNDTRYEEVMGNVFTTPILEVWNNEKYRRFRTMQLRREWMDIPMCVRCDSWSCRSRRYVRQGDLLVSQFPFYQHIMPSFIPAVPAAPAVPAPPAQGQLAQFVNQVKQTGRSVRQTLVDLGSRLRKAS